MRVPERRASGIPVRRDRGARGGPCGCWRSREQPSLPTGSALVGDAYIASGWTAFFQTAVAAAAALLGLPLVGVSLNIALIADSPKHRARAREALQPGSAPMVADDRTERAAQNQNSISPRTVYELSAEVIGTP
jgi:hypothetical protein